MSTAAARRAPRSTKEDANLRVVRRKERNLIQRGKSRKLAPATIVGAIVAATLLFGVLLERVALSQSAFKLWDIRKELALEEERHEELLLEAARLESPARIERYARTRLGMIDPETVEYIVADIPTRNRAGLAAATRPKMSPPTGPVSAQGVSP